MKFKQSLLILSAILIAVLVLSSGCIPTVSTTPETPTVNTGTITGVVNGSPGVLLAGATLTVVGTDISTVTDNSGNFTLKEVPPGVQDILVTWRPKSGEVRRIVKVIVTPGIVVTVNISLSPVSEEELKLYAIIVGVNNYLNPTIPDLNFCIADAQDLKNTLLNSTMWSSVNIIYLPDATRSQIENAIKRVAGKVGSDSLVLFSFSGHGTLSPDGSHAYICPADSSIKSFANDIEDDELERWLDGIPTNRRCVILDTCYSGAFLKKPSPDLIVRTYLKKGQKLTIPLAGTGFYKKLNKAGYVVLVACDNNKYSQESPVLQNGVFTYYLVEGFNSPYGADINSDQEISAEESYYYANPKVTAFTMSQHPQLYDGYPEELTLKTY